MILQEYPFQYLPYCLCCFTDTKYHFNFSSNTTQKLNKRFFHILVCPSDHKIDASIWKKRKKKKKSICNIIHLKVYEFSLTTTCEQYTIFLQEGNQQHYKLPWKTSFSVLCVITGSLSLMMLGSLYSARSEGYPFCTIKDTSIWI